MLISRLGRGRLARVRDGVRDESGVALAAVIGMVAVVTLIGTVVVSSSVNAAGFATLTRAGLQSRAAADAGIDAVLAQMDAGTFVCSLTGTSPAFSATVSYTNASGALTCGGSSLSGTPTAAQILSTGTAATRAAATATASNSLTEGAKVVINVTPGGVTLDQAVFSEAAISLTNATTINESSSGKLDGDLYSNGAITCAAQGTIHGTIYASNGLSVSGQCTTFGSVWVKGDVSLGTAQPNFQGSIYSTGAVTLGSAAFVGGSIIANNNVIIDSGSNKTCSAGGTADVCGSIFSLNGSVKLGQNGSVVNGSVYARTAITLGNKAKQPANNVVVLAGALTGNNSGTVGGTAAVGGALNSFNSAQKPTVSKTCAVSSGYSACPANGLTLTIPLPTNAAPAFAVSLPMFSPTNATNLGTPASTVTVLPPPREGMPQIMSSTSAISTNWTSAGWNVLTPAASVCASQSAMSTYLNTTFTAESLNSKTLINLKNCTTAVSWNNYTATINGDTAIMSPYGFSSSNDLTITSKTSVSHDFMMIVPSDAPGVSWSTADATTGQQKSTCTQSNNISLNDVKEASTNPNSLFLYTPCAITIQNTSTILAQIYSGSATLNANNLLITRATASIPGVTVPGGASSTASYLAQISSRFDIGG